MRFRILVLSVALAVALSAEVAPPVAAATLSSGGYGFGPVTAEAQGAAVVGDRTTCEGSADTVLTNLGGSAADELEELQAKYEGLDGFRAVVFDGAAPAIVVAPDALSTWREKLADSGLAVVASCVSTSLLDAARRAVNETDVGDDGFSSVGYDALLDAVSAISTAPIGDIVARIDAAVPGASDAAIAHGALRITEAGAGDFSSAASRGADSSPFWGGAKISTDIGGCSTGFYLNSSTNGTVMLTAGHCFGGNGKTTKNGNQTLVVGTSKGRSIDPDTALVDGQD